MTSCPICGTSNREGSRFCNECGRRLDGTTRCPSCGLDNPGNSRFCSGCGGTLPGPVAAEPASLPAAPLLDPTPAPNRRPDAEPGPGAEPGLSAPGDVAASPDAPEQEAAPEPLTPAAQPQLGWIPGYAAPATGRSATAAPTAADSPSSGFVPSWDIREDPPTEQPTAAAAPARDPEAQRALAIRAAEELVEPEVEPPTAPETASEEERGLVLARSLSSRRPRIKVRAPHGTQVEAGRAFAAAAAFPSNITSASRKPRRRLDRRIASLTLILLLLLAVALLYKDQVRTVPSWAVEAAPRVITQAKGLVGLLPDLATGARSGDGQTRDGQSREGGR